jgi:RNA polymerase sigma-70 factor (ECF subfamily)
VICELYPSLCRFAAIIAPPEVEPDDLVQEALYQVLRRTAVSDLEHPTAYLRRTILNLLSNHRRSSGRLRRALARMNPAIGVMDTYPSDLEMLLRLSPKARAVIFMRDIEGRSYAEIADAAGCREATARATASRARRELRNILFEEERNETA